MVKSLFTADDAKKNFVNKSRFKDVFMFTHGSNTSLVMYSLGILGN